MSQNKLWNTPFVVCLILQALYMLSFNMVTPLIAQYVVVVGESTATAGLIAGMFSFLAFLFRPFVGYASDRLNRKAFMVAGLVLCSASMAGYGLSTSVIAIALFRVVHAFALCIQTTVITVMASDYLPRGRMAEGVGYVGIAAMVGMSFGPGIGVFIAQSVGHQASFFSGAAIMLTALAAVLPLPNVHVPKKWGQGKISIRDVLDVPALPLSIVAMSFAFCAGLTTSFMVLLGSVRGIEGVALFFFVSSVGMVFVRPVAGRYTDRHGIKRIGFVGFASECLAMVCAAFAQSLIPILASAIFRVFGQGVAQTSVQGQVLKEADEESRGVASSTFYLGIDVGQGLGAIVGGMLADNIGFTAMFLSGPCMLIVGLVSFLIWGSSRKKARSSVSSTLFGVQAKKYRQDEKALENRKEQH